MNRRMWLCLFALAPLAAVTVAMRPVADDAVVTRPIVSWSGPRSAIAESEFVLITTRDQWRDLWSRHTGGKGERLVAHGSGQVIPEIDFGRHMVVAYFRGSDVNSDGEIVKSIHETDDAVVVRFDSYSFQTAGFGGDGGAASVTPYGIWLLPRIEKPVIIEENVQNLKAGEPVWRERHRFEALRKVW